MDQNRSNLASVLFVIVFLFAASVACSGQILKKVDHALDLLEQNDSAGSTANSTSETPSQRNSNPNNQSTTNFTTSSTGTPMTNATGGVTTGAIGTTQGLD